MKRHVPSRATGDNAAGQGAEKVSRRLTRRLRLGARTVGLGALILAAAGCGGDSPSKDSELILRTLLMTAPGYRGYVEKRGGLRSVACDSRASFPSGAIVGCTVVFASSTERWALIEGGPLQAVVCPRSNGPLRTLLASVCESS
jgi:hypothetical protein